MSQVLEFFLIWAGGYSVGMASGIILTAWALIGMRSAQ